MAGRVLGLDIPVVKTPTLNQKYPGIIWDLRHFRRLPAAGKGIYVCRERTCQGKAKMERGACTHYSPHTALCDLDRANRTIESIRVDVKKEWLVRHLDVRRLHVDVHEAVLLRPVILLGGLRMWDSEDLEPTSQCNRLL